MFSGGEKILLFLLFVIGNRGIATLAPLVIFAFFVSYFPVMGTLKGLAEIGQILPAGKSKSSLCQ